MNAPRSLKFFQKPHPRVKQRVWAVEIPQMWARYRNICVKVSEVWFHYALCGNTNTKQVSNYRLIEKYGIALIILPDNAVLMMIFPRECPTKLSLTSLKKPDLETLSIFFLRKEITSCASLSPISLKSPDVLSSFASDIRNSILGSIKSHWLRTRRKSRWCPWCVVGVTNKIKPIYA